MKKIISLLLAVLLCAGIIPCTALADNELKIDNNYIEVVSKADGSSFGINTKKGIPAKRFDDDKPLLYDGDDQFATSYTTVRIIKNAGLANAETHDYIYGSSAGKVTAAPQVVQLDSERRAIVSKWAVEGVEVTQNIIINGNTASESGGYANIQYSYTNSNSSAVWVGIRILLDTKTADNDAGSFFKNGGTTAISRETEFTGDSIPEWYSVSDSVNFSTTTAYGLLQHKSMRRTPDKVQMAHWYNLANTLWDYTVNPGMNFDDYYNEYFYPDSAVSIIYDTEVVEAGETLSVDTMYGVGELGGMESSPEHCVMTVTQKELLKANEKKDGYANDGEITLYVTVDNSDAESSPIINGKLQMIFQDKVLDSELNMVQEPAIWTADETEESEVLSIGNINRGEIRRNIPVKLKARPVYEKNKNNKDADAPDIVYEPKEGYTLRTSIDTRKITFSLTGDATPVPTVGSKVITMPPLGDSKVSIAFTGIEPTTIYYEGTSYFSVMGYGQNFKALSDKSNWTAFLTDVVSGEIINIDSFSCSVDTENRQLGLLVDMDGRLGEYTLTIKFKNNLEGMKDIVFSDSSQRITSTNDVKYKNRGYSIAVVARTSKKRDYDMRLFTVDTGMSESGLKSVEQQFQEYKESLGEDGEMLMEARGIFKILYKDGKDAASANKEKGFCISTSAEKNNPDLLGFETVGGSDGIKVNRILYYDSNTPLRMVAEFGSNGLPNVMKLEGDGDLSVIGASTIWKHKFMIRLPMDALFSYDTNDFSVEAPKLQLLGGGWLLQNLGGFIFDLNYGVLGCQDGRYTIDFSGQVSFPLGMSKGDSSSEGSHGESSGTSTGTPSAGTRNTASNSNENNNRNNNLNNNNNNSGNNNNNNNNNNNASKKNVFKDGNSATKKAGAFGDGGSLGVSIDSVLFGEHEDKNDATHIKTGFVGVAATVNLELPKSVFPAGGKQNNNSTISNGAAAANPTSSQIVSSRSSAATTAAGQNQNADNARSKNKGGLSAFSLGASFNTYEFHAGVDLGIGIGPLSTAFRMSLAEMNNGKICLDSIYLEVKGFVIPIVPGTLNLRGLGGGISDLASSINYQGEGRPPVTVSVMALIDILNVMYLQGDMSVSGNGLSFAVTGAPANFDQIKFIVKAEMDWTTGFTMRLSGTVDLFSGVVKGGVTLAFTTTPEFAFLGKIDGSLNVPGLGRLAGITLAITNKFIAGGIKVFIFSGGFVYYYDKGNFRLLSGSEVDELEDIDLDTEALGENSDTSSHTMSFLEVREIQDENGNIQYMGIGQGASVVATSVDRAVGSSYAKPQTLLNSVSFENNVDTVLMAGKDVVYRVYYDGDTAPELKVTKPDGTEYGTVIYDYDKTQEENNAAGANMLLSEKTDAETGTVKKYVYVNVSNNMLMDGNWKIESVNGVKISDYTVLSIPTVTPKLSIDSASIAGNTLSTSWTADDKADVTLLLVPCDENGNPAMTEYTDENGNTATTEHAGYIVKMAEGSSSGENIEINVPSGDYIVRLDSILNDSVYTSVYSKAKMHFDNPNTLAAPAVQATAGGDGRINVTSYVPQNATGINFRVFRRNDDGTSECLKGIGGYVAAEEGKSTLSTYFKGQSTLVDSSGAAVSTSVIEPGKTYYVTATAVNAEEGSGYYGSAEVQSADVMVPVPNPPQINVNITSFNAKNKTDDRNVSYTQIGNSNILIEYDILNMGAEPNDEVSVRFDIDEKQYGDVLKNDSSTGGHGYAAFNLSDGDHIVDIVFTNKAGDVTVETRKFSVDSIPADIKVLYPQNGSLYDPNVGIPVKILTDEGTSVEVYLDDTKVAGGVVENVNGANPDFAFERTIKVLAPKYSHEIKIVATDVNGNSATHIATVVNNAVSKISGIKILGTKPEGTTATELTAVGVDENGKELGIDIIKDRLKWKLVSDPSEAALTVQSGNSGAVVIPNGNNSFSVSAEWNVGSTTLTDIYDSGIVGEQSESGGKGNGGKHSSSAVSTELPPEVKELIKKVSSMLGEGSDVDAGKMYAGIDFTSKKSGNTVFAKGSDIKEENYLIHGTDTGTNSHLEGLPQGGKICSDVVALATLKEAPVMLVDLEVKDNVNTDNIGVYYFADSIGKWMYIGGTYDAQRKMISAGYVGEGRYVVIENPNMGEEFADIEGNWASLYIRSLRLAKLTDGYIESGIKIFKPSNEITRGEFVKLLVAAMGENVDDSDVSMFEDASAIADWAAPYAAAAYKKGWLQGSKTQTGIAANLSDKITRQDAMTLVYRVFFEGEKGSGNVSFSDGASVSEYAVDAVSFLTQNKIVSGYEDGTLKPLNFVLREQVAKILWLGIVK